MHAAASSAAFSLLLIFHYFPYAAAGFLLLRLQSKA